MELAKREKNGEDGLRDFQFFEEEYQLNHLIATLDKPFVALMNGITSTSYLLITLIHIQKFAQDLIPKHSHSFSIYFI